MFKRWFKRFLMAVTAFAILLVLSLIAERVRGQIVLARYQKTLVAKGEKLTARAFNATNATGENGAPAVLEAIKRLGKGSVLPDCYPPRMQLTPSGRAVVGFRELEWVENKRTNRWAQLADDLKTNEVVLAEIQVGLAKPVLNNGLDLTLGTKMLIPHLSPAKSLAHWFGSRSQLALHTGNTRAALSDLLTQIRLPRLLSEDHILISELVRIALAAIAKTSTWEALQAEGWADGDLANLQAAWAEQDFIQGMARSLESERVYMAAVSEAMRQSNDETYGAWFGWKQYLPVEDADRSVWDHLPYGEEVAEFVKKQVYCRVWRFAWLHQDELRSLKATQEVLELTRRAAVEKSLASVQASFEQQEHAFINRSRYDKLRFPQPFSDGATLPRAASKALRAETDRSMTISAIALKRYSLKHGKLPDKLDALVPEFVSAVPVDYMDGKPLRYRLNADGGFLLYSVGENLTDDAGDASAVPGYTAPRNPWFKKDYIWPAPATPEEVAAYHEEALKK